MSEIDREIRENLSLLLKLHLRGKLQKEIEFEKAKLGDKADVGATNFEETGGGKGGVPGSIVESEIGRKGKAKYIIKLLAKIQKMLDIYLDLLDEKTKTILKLHYRDRIGYDLIADRMGYTPGTVANKKSEAIGVLALRLDLDNEKEQQSVEYIADRLKKVSFI